MKFYWFTEDDTGDFTRTSDNVRGTVTGATRVSFPVDCLHVECETLTEALSLLGARMLLPQNYVNKRDLIKAIISLIPEDQRQAIADRRETTAAIAQLSDSGVDMTDPDLIAFVQSVNLTVEQVLAAM